MIYRIHHNQPKAQSLKLKAALGRHSAHSIQFFAQETKGSES